MYTEKNSLCSESLLEMFRATHDSHALYGLQVFSHIKNYESDLFRKDKEPILNYRFSDEREWRYIPSFDDLYDAKNHQVLLPGKSEFQTPEQKANYNDKIKHLKLTFEPNDIKYIIINNESEIREFIDFLRHVKGKTYTFDDVERLTTRIITTEQIFSDF